MSGELTRVHRKIRKLSRHACIAEMMKNACAQGFGYGVEGLRFRVWGLGVGG